MSIGEKPTPKGSAFIKIVSILPGDVLKDPAKEICGNGESLTQFVQGLEVRGYDVL